MSRLAALLMFCAWLLYGAMPAVGMSYMPVPAVPSAPAMKDHSQHRDHGKTVETAKAGHSHAPSQQPCPHGGKICATPFCAACLTLLPELAIGDDSPFHYDYPAPAIERALVSPAAAPLTPPPRG